MDANIYRKNSHSFRLDAFSLEMRIQIDWFTITFRFPSSIGIEWNYKEVFSFRFDQENDNFLDANIYRKNSHSFRLDAFSLEMRIQIDWFTITFRFQLVNRYRMKPIKKCLALRFDQVNDNFLDANIYRKNSHSFRLDAFSLEMRIQIDWFTITFRFPSSIGIEWNL